MYKEVLIRALCGFGLISLLLTVQIMAQSGQPGDAQKANEQTVRQLLSEVQQLRRAIERSNLTTYRAMIAVERLRLQQEQVARLTRELEGLHNSRNERGDYAKMMAERLKDLESVILLETDLNRRRQLEMEQKHLKLEMERAVQWEQQQQTREAELRAKLDVEQARLNELNERLDALERELEKQAATDQRQKSN